MNGSERDMDTKHGLIVPTQERSPVRRANLFAFPSQFQGLNERALTARRVFGHPVQKIGKHVPFRNDQKSAHVVDAPGNAILLIYLKYAVKFTEKDSNHQMRVQLLIPF